MLLLKSIEVLLMLLAAKQMSIHRSILGHCVRRINGIESLPDIVRTPLRMIIGLKNISY